MTVRSLAHDISELGQKLVKGCTYEQRNALCNDNPLEDVLRFINFRPRPHSGISLSEMSRDQRRNVLQLLALILSEHTFAQCLAIMAMEDFLDKRSGWSKGQHRDDFWLFFLINPMNQADWIWRFEGHHISLTVSVTEKEVSVTPIFLGIAPARITSYERDIFRLFAPEAEIARRLITMNPSFIISQPMPQDLLRLDRPEYPNVDWGVSCSTLSKDEKDLAITLVSSYLNRLAPSVNIELRNNIDYDNLKFGWQGAVDPKEDHYYFIHDGSSVSIEYINQRHEDDFANHEHTLIRSPRFDFGGILTQSK